MMSLMKSVRRRTLERLKMALGQDRSISISKLDGATGFPEQYFIDLGLTQGDLHRLERLGFASRGYTKNFWGPGETTPRGHVVKDDEYFRGNGTRLKWIIIDGVLP